MRFPLIRSCNSLLVGIAAITAAPFVNLPGAMAADAGNGKTLYNTAMGGVACSASICHGPSPAANLNSTMKGANNPAAISSAIAANAGGTMGAAEPAKRSRFSR
ncbi:MAG: hypothetical protein HY777_02165 [Betaproteobacteria bacterium]|nr:hypothetical protein [Betaproteobacteria bacterium]